MRDKPRFGIGINDERIPSGLMGKTSFAKKFEQSIRMPFIDQIFTLINKLTTSDEILRILAQSHRNPLNILAKVLDFVGVPIDRILLKNNSSMKIALFGKINAPYHHSALMGLIIHQMQQYISDWRNRQQKIISV